MTDRRPYEKPTAEKLPEDSVVVSRGELVELYNSIGASKRLFDGKARTEAIHRSLGRSCLLADNLMRRAKP